MLTIMNAIVKSGIPWNPEHPNAPKNA